MNAYSHHIALNEGAILSCVMGGKMSEGINFSGDLGRCVFIIGMPYPNKNDPLLKAQCDYYHKHGSNLNLMESKCMNVVNQSIGRVIRNVSDYGSIVLVDSRYAQDRVKNKLPRWIQKRAKPGTTFKGCYAGLTSFFASHKME